MSSANSEMDEKENRTILGDLEATRRYWETKNRPTNNPEFVVQPSCKYKGVCQPAIIARRRNAYMKLDNQLATAYCSSPFFEQNLPTFVDHDCLRSVFYEEAEHLFLFESPTTIIEGDVLAYAYRICIWFLEKREIRDLLFKNCKNIGTTLLTIFESVVEFLYYCVLHNIGSPSSHFHFICYGCTLLQSLFSHASGKHGTWRSASSCQDVVAIVEKVLQVHVPKLGGITAADGNTNFLSQERLLSLINVSLDTLLSLISFASTIEEIRTDKKGPYWIVLLLPVLLQPDIKWKIIELLNKSFSLTTTLPNEISDLVHHSCNADKLVDKMVDYYKSGEVEENRLYVVQLWTNIVRLLAPNMQNSLHIFNKLFQISKDAFVKATPVIRIAMFRGWQELFDECLKYDYLIPISPADSEKKPRRKINHKKLMHIISNPVFRRFSKEHNCLMVRKVILEVWVYFIKRMGGLGLLDEYIEELLLPFCKILQEESNLELVTQICSTFARALGKVRGYSPHGHIETKMNLAKRRKLYSTKIRFSIAIECNSSS